MFIVFRRRLLTEVCKSWDPTVKIALPLSPNTLPKLQRIIYFENPSFSFGRLQYYCYLHMLIFFWFFSFLCLQTLLVKHHTEKYGVLSFIVV